MHREWKRYQMNTLIVHCLFAHIPCPLALALPNPQVREITNANTHPERPHSMNPQPVPQRDAQVHRMSRVKIVASNHRDFLQLQERRSRRRACFIRPLRRRPRLCDHLVRVACPRAERMHDRIARQTLAVPQFQRRQARHAYLYRRGGGVWEWMSRWTVGGRRGEGAASHSNEGNQHSVFFHSSMYHRALTSYSSEDDGPDQEVDTSQVTEHELRVPFVPQCATLGQSEREEC